MLRINLVTTIMTFKNTL